MSIKVGDRVTSSRTGKTVFVVEKVGGYGDWQAWVINETTGLGHAVEDVSRLTVVPKETVKWELGAVYQADADAAHGRIPEVCVEILSDGEAYTVWGKEDGISWHKTRRGQDFLGYSTKLDLSDWGW